MDNTVRQLEYIPPVTYFGRTAENWGQFAISLAPIFFIMVLLALWTRQSQKKHANHVDEASVRSKKMLENQELAISQASEVNEKILASNKLLNGELMKTNALLQQLIEKLDKK